MSGTENNQAGTLDERLRLGAGFAAADRPRILRALSALAPHLSGWEHDQGDLDHALADVRRDLIRRIEEERSRREPRKRRKTRYRTT